jgi:hypothetical protein
MRIGKGRRTDSGNLATLRQLDPLGADTKATHGATIAQGQRTGFDRTPGFLFSAAGSQV